MPARLKLYAWGAAMALRWGIPEHSLGFLGGIGDDLLCTAPIHELLQRGAKRIWFFTRHPELYAFDRRVRLLPGDRRGIALSARLHRPVQWLSYGDYDATSDVDTPVGKHIIAEMCQRAGVRGTIALRPHLRITEAERQAAAEHAGAIAIQSSGMSASLPMRNKQWEVERFQAVIDHFAGRGLRFVQLGAATDPPLRGAADCRGRLGLRASAAVLSQARLFVGVVGFLMHLARAVDCPAVIVYGGREPADLTGYVCNTNIAARPACSPCWQRNRCDFGHACMQAIAPAQVVAGINDMLARCRDNLATDRVIL